MNIAPAFAIDNNDNPFVEWGEGIKLQLLAANTDTATFVVRLRFQPGIQLPPHTHTGCVHALTIAGQWGYLEFDGDDCTAGTYLHEPAGSTHTLKIADITAETDVFFIVEGAMLHLDEEGSVMAIGDAKSHVDDYKQKCVEQGLALPNIVLGGESRLVNLADI
jgi:quercetin dioxygenase-like cupin family protein